MFVHAEHVISVTHLNRTVPLSPLLLRVFKYSSRQMAIIRGVAIKSVTYSGEIWCDSDNGEIDCAHDCLPQIGFYAN